MPAETTMLPVEFLFTMRAALDGPTIIPSAPHGTRILVPVTGGEVTGPKVNGTLRAQGGDWVTMRADGSAQLDVRLTILTDDGAAILMEYKGVLSTGDDRKARVAPLFQTGDERYAWLNGVQAIAIGVTGQGDVTYEVYAVR
jgi:hypothetical protein